MTLPWHSEADMPCRRRILQELLNFFTRCPQVSQTPEWRDRFPDFLRRLELTLYLNADCREEYADSSTVVDRLRAVTLHLQRQRVEQMQRAGRLGPGPHRGPRAASRAVVRPPGSVHTDVAALSGRLRGLRTRSGGPGLDPGVLAGPEGLEQRMLGGIEASRDDAASEGREGSMSSGSGAVYGVAPRPKAGGYGPPSMLGPGGETTPRRMVAGLAPHGGGLDSRDLRRSVSMSEAYSYGSGIEESGALGYGHPFPGTGRRTGDGLNFDDGMSHFGPAELRFVPGVDMAGEAMDSVDCGGPVLMGPAGRVRSPGFGGQQGPGVGSPRVGDEFLLAGGQDVLGLGVVYRGANPGRRFGSPSVATHEMEGSLPGEQRSVPMKASGTYPLPQPEGIDHEANKLYRSLSTSRAMSPK
ncbi:unnamed protein product [Ostreobium quekettii]|uniref:Uncharacterized protein n=1 Tax=Ostreobium quekettii TaxID=121088 RepID=A0A8S1IMS6_9CHLO|nr:unnamed protein product [Ostreobium quekettii]|eukprot:evm.model.scf_399.8 EVM.evm.TU.scf_399.8   scf_399:74176-76320(+)